MTDRSGRAARTACAALVFATFGPSVVHPVTAAAQEPSPANRDSLLARFEALRARVDSLEGLIEELQSANRPVEQETDELAALRAAAAEAAAGADTTAAAAPAAAGGGGLLNRLNPEISVTGDVRAQGVSPGPQEDAVSVREFEFAFQSALDPYASTKVFLTWEDGHVDLEEGYVYWSGLPGGLRLDLGRLRAQAGKINRTHLHALPESEYPLVIRQYMGEEGLVLDEAQLYWLAPFHGPGGSTHELFASVSVGGNSVLFEEGNRPSYLGHLNNFWQLSPSTFFELGATALYGDNRDENLETWLYGMDARLKWTPPGSELYRSLTLQGEWFGARKRREDLGDLRSGWYVDVDVQPGRQWHVGARYDRVEPLEPFAADPVWAIVPRVTWSQSEWVYVRAEWQHFGGAVEATGEDTTDRFLVQVVWAMGPHKHESY